MRFSKLAPIFLNQPKFSGIHDVCVLENEQRLLEDSSSHATKIEELDVLLSVVRRAYPEFVPNCHVTSTVGNGPPAIAISHANSEHHMELSKCYLMIKDARVDPAKMQVTFAWLISQLIAESEPPFCCMLQLLDEAKLSHLQPTVQKLFYENGPKKAPWWFLNTWSDADQMPQYPFFTIQAFR